MNYDGRLSMFDKTEYVIEMKLGSAFLEPVRDTYNVKDAYGNLLGYAKKQRLKLWPKFWFEGTDGTRMGEIRSSKKGYGVYDAQNQLRATIREKQKQRSPSKKKKSLLGVILFVAGLPVAMFAFVLYLVTLSLGFFVIIFVGAVLTALGMYYLFSTYEEPEWLVEDPDGQQLAEIKQVGKFFAEYQVLTPDGDIIANIHKKRGLSAFRYSYSIDITRQVLDSLFIISYAILRADRDKAITSAASTPSGF